MKNFELMNVGFVIFVLLLVIFIQFLWEPFSILGKSSEKDLEPPAAASDSEVDEVGENKLDLSRVKDYNVYYGDITPEILEDMKKNYQLLILDPFHVTDEQINSLKESGLIVYGYISVSHIGAWDKGIIEKLDSEDYLGINGEKISYKNEGYLGDIRKKHYQDVLLDTIDERIIQKGFEGIFLDTPEYYELPSIVKGEDNALALSEACIDFIGRIKNQYPTISLFQNRGFKILDMGSKKYVDAILYETYNAENTSSYYQNVNSMINEARQNYGVECFAFSPKDNIHQSNTAKSMGWKYQSYIEEDDYVKWRFTNTK